MPRTPIPSTTHSKCNGPHSNDRRAVGDCQGPPEVPISSDPARSWATRIPVSLSASWYVRAYGVAGFQPTSPEAGGPSVTLKGLSHSLPLSLSQSASRGQSPTRMPRTPVLSFTHPNSNGRRAVSDPQGPLSLPYSLFQSERVRGSRPICNTHATYTYSLNHPPKL